MIVGIDLGTTNSLVGAMDAGFPILLADRDGQRLTPSIVHFPTDGAPFVGSTAARMRAVSPDRTIYSSKRFIGRRSGEIPSEEAAVSYPISTASAGVTIPIDEALHTPENIAALILTKLKADAETALETEVTGAVITVPAYFNDAQRNATKRAGELAGLTVERIINEPTAAALAYGLDRLDDKSTIAVYDFGGGTFDISILELNEGVFQVLSTNGNTHLGGDDIDRALVDFLCEKMDLPPLASDDTLESRLREVAIDAKHKLSADESATVSLPFAIGTESRECVLTRNEFENIARPIIERTRAHCLRSLADADKSPDAIDKVILVGGSTRIPAVRQLVEAIFQQTPDTSQNPDEAIGIGATIQAGILSGAVRDVVLLDVTPLSLGIETFGGLMNVIIPRNSTIPLKAGEMFTNAVVNQASMRITVLQGEREMARDNWQLGEFDIPFEPAPKGQARVGVQFEIDANGILTVLARDTTTGKEKIVTMKSAVDVSDEKVEQMIAESVEHAFDDMSERIRTEALLKSKEMIPAVENALKQVGDDLTEDDLARIDTCLADVRQAMETGSAQTLKKANAALDDATQHMATFLVEKAMEDALKRKGLI